MGDETIYGFRTGSIDYPTSIAGPFYSLDEARDDARRWRAYGKETGRVRKVTEQELAEAQDALASGVLRSGWWTP